MSARDVIQPRAMLHLALPHVLERHMLVGHVAGAVRLRGYDNFRQRYAFFQTDRIYLGLALLLLALEVLLFLLHLLQLLPHLTITGAKQC